ncbi:MAG: hypothetical protein GEU79_10490 [Acidimicrobiia bacterium]|nr:hypothetical protein [Acidimicrobiia bacterium]
MRPQSKFARRHLSLTLLAALFLLLVALPVLAEDGPDVVARDGSDIVLPQLDADELGVVSTEEDPLGLVPFSDFVKAHSFGIDVIEVWTCGIDDSPQRVVDKLRGQVTPYFDALSRGAYRTSFVVGGSLGSTGTESCLSETANRSPGTSNAALIAIPGGGGFAGPGNNGPHYPSNQRWAVVGYDHGFVTVAAHEIGHTIHFPHSFTGKAEGNDREYDNARDLMSGNYGTWTDDGSTHWGTYPWPYEAATINRYAAGWITPEEVRMVGVGRATFTLTPSSAGDEGYQMGVIRVDDGSYITLGASTKAPYDPIPQVWEGVDVYEVRKCPHENIVDCYNEQDFFGFRRHISRGDPFEFMKLEAYREPIDLVIPPGSTAEVGDRMVSVARGNGGRFLVEVSAGVFGDTKDSVFRKDIQWLLGERITLGCNPPENSLFCPGEGVTRGQMAAFLRRALPDLKESEGATDFSDDDTSVFEEDVEWLSSRGITRGCNPPANSAFCPTEPVTRGEMAAFLHRALPDLEPSRPPSEFTDVDGSSTFSDDIEWLSARGVTFGCNPPGNYEFCPNEPVTRGEMAAFLRRALTG